MGDIFHGGLGSVKVDAAGGDFTTPIATFTQFAEGGTMPVPAAQTANLANAQRGPTGSKVSFSLRILNATAANADAVRDKGFAMERVDVRFTDKSGTLTFDVLNVLPIVETAPIAEFGAYGYVLFEGDGVGAGATKPYTYTKT